MVFCGELPTKQLCHDFASEAGIEAQFDLKEVMSTLILKDLVLNWSADRPELLIRLHFWTSSRGAR